MKNIIHNPVLEIDYPDPEVIRVGDSYYMTTTSTHFTPSVPILKSRDLKHWEIISYVTDIIEDNGIHRLEDGKNGYGSGVWATTLRYHKGVFYVMFNCNEEQNTYVYRTNDIEKEKWEKSVIYGMHHDLSLFFDDDDRVYIVYGNGDIRITELTADVSGVKEGGIDQILVKTQKISGLNCEGSHFYKINGKYYLFLINWPIDGTQRRLEWCYRSDTLLGNYEGRKLMDSSMGYYNNGVAQGGIFDTPNGDWYMMLFQDRFSAGRFPVLVSVKWKDGWPLMGKEGSGEAEEILEVNLPISRVKENLYGNDEFDYTDDLLHLYWQWNHNPDNTAWSVTARPGWLRLINRNPRPDLESARNTLTQKLPFPWCTCETFLDTSGMCPGDVAGIAAFQANYAYVGVRIEENGLSSAVFGISDGKHNVTEIKSELKQKKIWLKIVFDFRDGGEQARDLAYLMYSLDGMNWIEWNAALRMKYTLDHFTGYRIAMFSFNTHDSKGYADFDYLRFDTECKER